MWAASITKGVFGTYVMQLVERGEFDLDLPVARQLERPLDEYQPYRESSADLVHDSAWGTVTPRMLLAHSSGLHNFASLEPDKRMQLHFAPGTRFAYAGEGINLVQFIIEQRKHASLHTLMQHAIFGPAGMTRTGLIYRPEFEADVADRYDASGKFISMTRRFPARAAGSMTSSAEDLARFAIALMNGRLIAPATQAAMLAPYRPIRSLHQFALDRDEPDGPRPPRPASPTEWAGAC